MIVSGRMPCPHARDASFYWCVAMRMVFKVRVYAMTLWFLTWVGTVMESMMHAFCRSVYRANIVAMQCKCTMNPTEENGTKLK